MTAASTPNNNDVIDINKGLDTYKDRILLDLNNFQKQLETQSKIEVECMQSKIIKKKTEFEHELRHQTQTHTRTIDSLQEANKPIWHVQLHNSDRQLSNT